MNISPGKITFMTPVCTKANTNSVAAMINSLNWPSLDSRRTYFKLIM